MSLAHPALAENPFLLLHFTVRTSCAEAAKWGQDLPLLLKCTGTRRVRVFAAEYTGAKPVGAALKEIEKVPGLRRTELVLKSDRKGSLNAQPR